MSAIIAIISNHHPHMPPFAFSNKEALFDIFIERSHIAYFMVRSSDFAIEWCNQKAVNLFEFESQQAFIGKFGHHYHVDRFSNEDIQEVQQILDEKGFFRTVYRYKTDKGNLFWGLLETRRVSLDDKAYHIVSVMDITEEPNLWSDGLEREVDFKRKSFSHLIKNNLLTLMSMIHLQLSKNSFKEESRAAMEDVYRRINTIAVLHDQLSYSRRKNELNVSEYLDKIVGHVLDINAELDVTVEYKIADLELNSEVALKLGMIVNELISNSIRHAFSADGENYLRISLEKQFDGAYQFTYLDRGRGQGTHSEGATSNKNGLGMMVIESLSTELGGDFTYQIGAECFEGTFSFSLN